MSAMPFGVFVGLFYWCLLLPNVSARYFSIYRQDLPPQQFVNSRPIIGILSQEPPSSLESLSPNSSSYIAASYVKFVEGAGARVVPIRVNQPDSYYINIFNSINGLLFPGGGVSIETSGYALAGRKLFQLAKQANDNGDFFPVWATCLGFEMLTYLSADLKNLLTSCHSNGRALNLNFQPNASKSRLFQYIPNDIRTTLSNEASTSNFHQWCLTPDNFTLSELNDFYDILTTNQDDNGLTFVSSMEAKKYPIWGLQFHPEKNIYEWSHPSIPHSPNAIKAGQYFAEFFVNQARQNPHAFSSKTEEEQSLIYNYQPIYTGHVSTSFEQCYFFY